jgi:hypothetical protein
MITSTMKKETKIETNFENGKMYIHEDGDLVVAYIGEGDHGSTFHGIVLHRQSTKYGWKIFDESSCFIRRAFREFHGEVTLRS